MYQTDFSGELRKDGCLFMSLLNIAEEESGKKFDYKSALSLYNKLNSSGAMGTENSQHQDGAFIYNHIEVLNKASAMLGSNAEWEYSGRIYESWEEEKGRESFGTHKDADYIILQIQTPYSGHFRRLGYDPWGGGTTALYIKSTRYYRIKE